MRRMSSTPIHPGEHFAEELSALGLSAAGLARHLKVNTNQPHYPNPQRAPCDLWGHRHSTRTLFRHECTILDESADPL